MTTILEKVNTLPGYRIVDSHFRIGSKIHVSDFYFAKTFFQNSFYASRIAFLLAKQIKAEPPGEAEFKRKGLTIIGYGLYSELLVSLIERFLKPVLNDRVNHDVVEEQDEPQLMRGYESIHKYVAIVVPIASTFSTSMKIEDSLASQPGFADRKFLASHFNVLHIDDVGMKASEKVKLTKQFGWLPPLDKDGKYIKEPKYIEVKPFFADPSDSEEVRRERFLIRLPTKWHPVNKCELCFPTKDPLIERPLFINDRSNVTPDLVFTYPREQIKSGCEKFEILPQHLIHDHLEQRTSHFRFFVRIEPFFRHNEKRVDAWLRKLGKKKLVSESDKVVIIAPAQFSNAAFVNKVNNVLFSDSATILHYDPNADDIQNFEIFYGREFRPEVKVFFVDDTITTGKTFLKTNYFIKHTRPDSNTDISGLDGVIVLLDRSTNYVYRNVERKLRRKKAIYAFAGLHIPLLRVVNNVCPLCHENERYIKLAERSYVDVTKSHLLMQAGKLARKNSLIEAAKGQTDCASQRGLKKIEAMFRIIEWFSEKKKLDPFESPRAWVEKVFGDVKLPFQDNFLRKDSEGFLSEKEASVLKALTFTQLTHHKPIKSIAFSWVLKLLAEKVACVNTEITNRTFTHESLRELKFLMRRAGFLGSNYLISEDFFHLLRHMLAEETIRELNDAASAQRAETDADLQLAAEDENRQPSLLTPLIAKPREVIDWGQLMTDFTIFYVAQVKELCSISDSRCVRLEDSLRLRLRDPNNEFPPRFQQVLRLLSAENSIVVENFWELVRKQVIKDDNIIDDPDFAAVFKNLSEHSHYRYQTLLNFLGKSGARVEKDEKLNKFLELSLFFEQEHHLQHPLEEKTATIVDGLRSIVGSPGDGAFLLVKYKESSGTARDRRSSGIDPTNHFVAYNNGDALSTQDIFSNKQGFLEQFLSGKYSSHNSGAEDKTFDPSRTATVIELHHSEENGWTDAYSANNKSVDLDQRFLEGHNRLLLMRFSTKRLVDGRLHDAPLGIVGVFYKIDPEVNSRVLLEREKVRYLLLLRGSINSFISSHHNNSAFRDWVEADKVRRVALLTGHGREMLLRFATDEEDTRYGSIVRTILFVQRLIIDHQDEAELFRQKRIKSKGGIFSVSQTFKNLFPSKPQQIDKEYLDRFEEMVKRIFESELIENPVDFKLACSVIEEGFKLNFPTDLLDMIFFELLVNAKKNRWIFDDGETFKKGEESISCNQISIHFGIEDKAPFIAITNTGPKVDKDTMDRIFTEQPMKNYDSVAGTKHIETLLRTFDLGEAKLEQDPFDGGLYLITARIKFKCIK